MVLPVVAIRNAVKAMRGFRAISSINDARRTASMFVWVQSETVSVWTHTNIEAVLRASLIEEMALKPRIAFTALRIATTGSTISPPLFESMELLGKEACLLRINAGLAL